MIGIAERSGFELRDLESLRSSYALTLRHWVANLEAEWDRAVELVGERRARAAYDYLVSLGVPADRLRTVMPLDEREAMAMAKESTSACHGSVNSVSSQASSR